MIIRVLRNWEVKLDLMNNFLKIANFKLLTYLLTWKIFMIYSNIDHDLFIIYFNLQPFSETSFFSRKRYLILNYLLPIVSYELLSIVCFIKAYLTCGSFI